MDKICKVVNASSVKATSEHEQRWGSDRAVIPSCELGRELTIEAGRVSRGRAIGSSRLWSISSYRFDGTTVNDQ